VPEQPCSLTPGSKSRRAAKRRNRKRPRRGGTCRQERHRLLLALHSAAAMAHHGHRHLPLFTPAHRPSRSLRAYHAMQWTRFYCMAVTEMDPPVSVMSGSISSFRVAFL